MHHSGRADTFLPASAAEMRRRGWDAADVILVSGDAYIDSPFSGAALIGRALEARGLRVGLIAQPDTAGLDDIRRLGAPRLCWGVTAGCVDSMVANYTAAGKRRRQDDFTPGGANDRRPDRACIVYSNLIRRAFRPCAPIVLGGIEASLRRIAHYDFWSDSVRRSILLDAKADALVYGMGERSFGELVECLRDGRDWRNLRGLCRVAACKPDDALELPAFEEVAPAAARRDDGDGMSARRAFLTMTRTFMSNQDWRTARTLAQRHENRWVVQTPPAEPLSSAELDAVHALPFQREAHPGDAARGEVRALETIRFAIATHRGCYGGCNFCAIAAHQGRLVRSRSEDSILAEARRFTEHPRFRGVISDVGGPTANMYGIECARKQREGACADRHCLYPRVCPSLRPDHAAQTRLLKRLREVPGIRHVFVASGVRHDLVIADSAHGDEYLEELAAHHVSGQLKLAPEHCERRVLELMGKPDTAALLEFKRRFDDISRRLGKRQYLTYYFIAAHPGCDDNDMRTLRDFAVRHLHLLPEQVQVFTPTPSTISTAMYCTGLDYVTGRPLYVARGARAREAQKRVLIPDRAMARATKLAGRLAAGTCASNHFSGAVSQPLPSMKL
ncbi:MAG: YgiQ family radical SAM protein [Kiritimatiellae bacterium]|nr:YgiQ family radical SAM protein [Kiritimatiellia bacterium]